MVLRTKHILSIIILTFLIKQNILGQSGSAKFCSDAEPLCGSQEFYYPNTSGVNFSENGPDYGCLNLQLNPAWFYLQIAQSGNIVLKIEQSTVINGYPNLDVDYIIYGPFADSTSPCIENLEQLNIVDCSYSSNFIENVKIQNAKAGEYYLLLITNFSIKIGYIKVTQIEGVATTNCNILNEPSLTKSYACEGDIQSLDATTLNASHYVWYEINDLLDYDILEGNNTPKINVTSSKTYRAIAYDIDNVLLDIKDFEVNFYANLNVTSNIEYNICDNYGSNDGIAMFDLSSLNSRILNGEDESIFSFSYYNNYQDAINRIDVLPYDYINTNSSETIYVRAENHLSGSLECYSIGSISLSVNLLPSISLYENYILCLNANGTETISANPTVDTGLNTNNYNFIWKLNGNILPNETNSYLVAYEAGDYAVLVRNLLTNCSNYDTTFIIASSPPTLFSEVISRPFSENHIIEVHAIGEIREEYEYSIDNGIWQSNGIFNDVSFGEHEVLARDINGCGYSSVKVMVIDYPHYFTPNGDGNNDIWNVVGIRELNATVIIYDRYGKLLKQLDSNSIGWDGTYNGESMPTSDYWFVVTYLEPMDNSVKKFRSHFTLKR